MKNMAVIMSKDKWKVAKAALKYEDFKQIGIRIAIHSVINSLIC